MRKEARALLAEANAYFERGRYLDAVGTSRRGLAVQPDEVRFQTLMTRCYVKLGKGREAMDAAKKAMEMDPGRADCHLVLALALWSNRKIDEAMRTIGNSLRLYPNEPALFNVQARLFAAKGRWKESLRAAESGLALRPDDRALLEARGEALSRLGRTQEAQEVLARVVGEDPDQGSALEQLGWNELRSGNFQAAARLFQDALRNNPNDAMARVGLLDCLRAAVPPYRLVAKFNDKMRGLGPGLGLLSMLIFSAIRGVITSLGDVNKTASGWVAICIAVPVCFFLLLKPVSQCFVLFHPIGRDALYPAERALVWWFLVWFGVSLLVLLLIVLAPTRGYFGLFWPAFVGLGAFVLLSFTRDTSKSALVLAHVIGGGFAVFSLGYLVVHARGG